MTVADFVSDVRLSTGSAKIAQEPHGAQIQTFSVGQTDSNSTHAAKLLTFSHNLKKVGLAPSHRSHQGTRRRDRFKV